MSSFNFNYSYNTYSIESTGMLVNGTEQLEHVPNGFINNDWTVAIYPGNEELMTIKRTSECYNLLNERLWKNEDIKTIKVKYNADYVYCIRRTFVGTKYGLNGLFEIMLNDSRKRDGSNVSLAIMLDKIMETTKSVK